MKSYAVAIVESSKNDKFPVGSHVQGILPWSIQNVVDPATAAPPLRIVDESIAPLPAHIGVLGMPGTLHEDAR